MRYLTIIRRLAVPLGTTLMVFASSANGQQSLLPGFYSFEPEGVPLQITSANSGRLCTDGAGQPMFCGNDRNITVTDQESCTGTDGKQYRCTRYGYEFQYTGAVPGETIECTSTRRDPFNSRSWEYTLALDAAEGSVLRPSWIPYSPVERRSMLTEVHTCSYRGEKLASMEFIVTYEPGTDPQVTAIAPPGPAPGIDEPYLGEIPDSCANLTGTKAASLLQTDSVQAGAASEYVANLSSLCTYTSARAPFRTVYFLYKYMPYAMFDADTLSKTQLIFNAAMTGGGQRPYKVIEDLGKFTFLFDNGARTTVLVVTGIQGPLRANEPTEFVAFYYLEDPDRPHATRLQLLMEEAKVDFNSWSR